MSSGTSVDQRAAMRGMFGRLASRYELVNVVMSLGRVKTWRRIAAREALSSSGGRVLDVAAGDGGFSVALARRWPGARIAALDLTPEMIHAGRARTAGLPVRWTEGDALHLPFPDGAFDAVCHGFMLRNVADVRAALAEQVRVVRPGGRVVCLEMTWPRAPLFRSLFRFYFYVLTPLVGWLITGQRAAYRYLPRSVEAFLAPNELAAVMEQVGLRRVRHRLLMMGTVAIHVGEREGDGRESRDV